MTEEISSSLRSFLEQRLTSIEQIDIVLLLRGDAARAWSAPEVAEALRMPPEAAAMRLFLLASSGLIIFEATSVPRYRAAKADASTEGNLQELAAVNARNRGAIMSILGGSPADPVKSFADAFRLKK